MLFDEKIVNLNIMDRQNSTSMSRDRMESAYSQNRYSPTGYKKKCLKTMSRNDPEYIDRVNEVYSKKNSVAVYSNNEVDMPRRSTMSPVENFNQQPALFQGNSRIMETFLYPLIYGQPNHQSPPPYNYPRYSQPYFNDGSYNRMPNKERKSKEEVPSYLCLSIIACILCPICGKLKLNKKKNNILKTIKF
jgi:hypothetical protein